MKDLVVRPLTEGSHKGKWGVFEGAELVGLARFSGSEEIRRSNQILLAAESSPSPARRRLAERIKARMIESGETFALAELNVVRTPAGLALWEQARMEEFQ
jgi:hypothetical protein